MQFRLSLLLLFTCFLFNQCNLNYRGDTFLTVEGVITDSLNNPIENVDVVIRNDGTRFDDYAISAISSTDSKGKFRLTFPISNGTMQIGVSGEPYSVEELLNSFENISYSENSDNANWFFLEINERPSFSDFYFKADTIQIK